MTCGTATSRDLHPGNSTDSVPPALTNRIAAIDSTPGSCSSIPMPKPLDVIWSGMTRSTAIPLPAMVRISSATRMTVPLTRLSVLLSIRRSTGGRTGRLISPGRRL